MFSRKAEKEETRIRREAKELLPATLSGAHLVRVLRLSRERVREFVRHRLPRLDHSILDILELYTSAVCFELSWITSS